MFDNGLLKYYPKFATKSGCLNMQQLRDIVGLVPSESIDEIYKINDGRSAFYLKSETKPAVDSQVLISQALLKSGVGAPVYLPAKTLGSSVGTISEDIQCANCIQGVDVKDTLAKRGIYIPRSRISISPNLPIDYSSIFTKEGMRQLLKLNLFAAPTFLDDLTEENVFYQFDEQGKICGVSAIDFSESCGVSNSKNSRYFSLNKEIDYINYIGSPNDKTRSQMVEELNHNEIIQQYLPTQEQIEFVGTMAEEVGNIATDVKITTGYKISQDYVDRISTSLSDFATELGKV